MRTICVLALLVAMAGCRAAPTRLTVVPQSTTEGRTVDGIAMRYTDDGALIVVKHRSGVGRAVLERRQGKWPREVMMRFEGFATLEGVTATALDARGRAALQLTKEGGLAVEPSPRGKGFEVRWPHSLLDDRWDRVRVQWVDAYRK